MYVFMIDVYKIGKYVDFLSFIFCMNFPVIRLFYFIIFSLLSFYFPSVLPLSFILFILSSLQSFPPPAPTCLSLIKADPFVISLQLLDFKRHTHAPTPTPAGLILLPPS